MTIPISSVTNAEVREYDVTKHEKKIIIVQNEMEYIDIEFHKENELEFVYELHTKNNLPLDVWFVNDDNFLLLSAGSQFLYYTDGSGRQLSYARKIVTLDEYNWIPLAVRFPPN